MWKSILVASVVVLVALKYVGRYDSTTPLTKHLNASYDYVIVGGGSAGCVLANRLSADSDVTVLLIEAGPDDRGRDDISTPAGAPMLHHSDVDWDFYTKPLEGFQGYKQQKMYSAAGRVLGGGSAVNYMLYVRGHRYDYDQWEALGCEGWGYDDVLPYFNKSVKMDGEDVGPEGGVPIEECRTGAGLTDVLLKGGQEMGLPLLQDNLGVNIGVSRLYQTAYKGQRSSASRAYLHPVLTRPNLHVAVDTVVTKVLFENKRATGVNILRWSRKQTIKAKREVILSAGGLGSSKLLLLSGVGPKDHLKDVGIPLVADLPVGQNLQNHIFMDYHVTIDQPISITPDQYSSWWSKLKLMLFGSGPLSSVGADVQLYVKTRDVTGHRDLDQVPDVQVIVINSVFSTPVMAVAGHTEQALQDMSERDKIAHGFVCIPNILRPQSQGTLRLVNSDPFSDPDIDAAYLTHPDDLDILVKGLSVCEKLIQTKSLQEVGAKLTDVTSSACSAHGKYNTSHPEYWRCLTKRNARSMYHYSGTCKMGAASDPSAVVDPQLRVRGLEALRVVDTSIFPNIPSGNTNAAVIMTAEKAADVIRKTRHTG